jgi:hypothetical protein
MNPAEAKNRFEELDVARALGDLSIGEMREYEELKTKWNFQPDLNWDTVISSLEDVYSDEKFRFDDTFKQELSASITSIQEHSKVLHINDLQSQPLEGQSFGQKPDENPLLFLWTPAAGWVAACLAILFLIAEKTDDRKQISQPKLEEKTPKQLRDDILQLEETITADFQVPAEGGAKLGKVIWNSETQDGFMELADIPANDASNSQYQLWIVDPERDTKPVDGGVFDLSGLDGEIVPIKAALKINKPLVFVITEEQPGGVVVSAQEKVIAIAKIGS